MSRKQRLLAFFGGSEEERRQREAHANAVWDRLLARRRRAAEDTYARFDELCVEALDAVEHDAAEATNLALVDAAASCDVAAIEEALQKGGASQRPTCRYPRSGVTAFRQRSHRSTSRFCRR